jgi:hypothetical protein
LLALLHKDGKATTNPASGAYGVLGTGCQGTEVIHKLKFQSSTQFYIKNADSYASFALTMNNKLEES